MSETQAGPTPSPVTNELLALAAAVGAGAHDQTDTLMAKVATRREETDGAKAGFLQEIGTQTPDYMQTYADEIGHICNQFDAYAAALDDLAVFPKKKNPEQLAQAAHDLTAASIGLRMAMMHYENQVLSTGPSRFKPVNLLENLGKNFLEKRVDAETWEGTCQNWHDFHAKVVQEIDESPSKTAPGVPERRAASQRAMDATARLKAIRSQADLDAGIDQWRQAHEELEGAMRAFDEHVFFSGPTPSRQANLVIQIARGTMEGKYTVQALQEASEGMHERVREGLLEFQRLTSQPVEAPALLEAFPKMLEALEALDDMLEDITAATAGEAVDKPALTRALEEFEAAAVRLHQATEAVQHHNESEGKVPCPSCQTYNPAGSRFCSGCQRSLPQMAGGEGFGAVTRSILEDEGLVGATSGPVVTEKMKKLNDACIALANDEIADEDFLALVVEMENECQEAEAGLSQLRAPEIPEEATDEEVEMAQQFVDLAEDALGLLSEGVGECMAGLARFRAYVSSRNTADSLEGAQLYFEGIQKLYQVQRVDEAFQRALGTPPEQPPASAAPPAEEDAPTDDEPPAGEEDYEEEDDRITA